MESFEKSKSNQNLGEIIRPRHSGRIFLGTRFKESLFSSHIQVNNVWEQRNKNDEHAESIHVRNIPRTMKWVFIRRSPETTRRGGEKIKSHVERVDPVSKRCWTSNIRRSRRTDFQAEFNGRAWAKRWEGSSRRGHNLLSSLRTLPARAARNKGEWGRKTRSPSFLDDSRYPHVPSCEIGPLTYPSFSFY